MYLAEQGPEAVCSKEVAARTQVPGGYLFKVLGLLGRADLVRSQRGLGGGFMLAKPADQITVLEIMNVFEPVHRVTCCLLLRPGQAELCPLHRRLDEIAAAAERVFGNITLAELLHERLRFQTEHQLTSDDPNQVNR